MGGRRRHDGMLGRDGYVNQWRNIAMVENRAVSRVQATESTVEKETLRPR